MTVLDRFRLDGKVAIVTGAGKGIGAAIAVALAEAGADVAITSRTAADLDAVAADVARTGRRALVRPGDVNDLALLAELVERAASELGGADSGANNAGGSRSRPSRETTPGELEGSSHLNIPAPFEQSRLA